MLKNKSPEDINRVGNEGLFTELTPKESAAIEGGSVLIFTTYGCTKGTCPDTDVVVNGTTVLSKIKPSDLPFSTDITGFATIELKANGQVIGSKFVPAGVDVNDSLSGKGTSSPCSGGQPYESALSFLIIE